MKAERSRAKAWFKRWWPLPVFMAVGLLLRLWITVWGTYSSTDSMLYMHLAREIRGGAFFASQYDLSQGFSGSRMLPLLYPFLLAPFAGGGLDLETAGIVLSLGLSTLAFIPFFLAGQLFFSRRTAVLSLALLSFNTFASFYSFMILKEPLFTALYIAVILVSALALVRLRPVWFILTGVLAAAFYLTREMALGAMPILVLASLLKMKLIDRLAWRRVLALTGALVAAFMVTALPYLVHLRVRTGTWGWSSRSDLSGYLRFFKNTLGSPREGDEDDVEGEVRGQEAGGHGLARFAWAVLARTGRNLALYGLALVRRAGMFVLVFFLVGMAGVGRDCFSPGRTGRRFGRLYLLGWMLLLGASVGLLTSDMVDDRYMYPLILPYLLFAGDGITIAGEGLAGLLVDNNASPPGPAAAPAKIKSHWAAAAALPALAAIYFFAMPYLIHPHVKMFVESYFPSRPGIAFFFPSLGLAVLVTLALLPAVIIARQALPPAPRLVPGLMALTLIMISLLTPRLGLLRTAAGSPGQVPMLMVLGAGAGLFVLILAGDHGKIARHLFHFLAALMVAGAFLSQFADLAQRRIWALQPEGSQSAGNKIAAQEIKAQGLVPAGKVIVSRKPFLPYYLDGTWYNDPISYETVPDSWDRLEQWARSGQIDYFAADSFTLVSLRPQIIPLAFALPPLTGTRVVYSHYFPEYNRIITLIDVRHPEPLLPSLTSSEHLRRGRFFLDKKNLPVALREIDAALDLEPDHREAWLLKLKILQVYYRLAFRSDLSTFDTFPQLLPGLLAAAQNYARLSPEDPEAQKALNDISIIYRREQASRPKE